MSYSQADLAMARRHVAEGEARIVRQRVLIGELESRSRATPGAYSLLYALETTLAQMRQHLAQIEADVIGRA